jgi:hypothetical protein
MLPFNMSRAQPAMKEVSAGGPKPTLMRLKARVQVDPIGKLAAF